MSALPIQMTYGHYGYYLFEPASVFNKLAETGNRNSGLRIRRKSKSIGKAQAFIDTNPELVEIWECRRLPVVNFACVETQFLNSDLYRFVLIE